MRTSAGIIQCEHLAHVDALETASFPVRGVLYGSNRRVFVPLTVRHARGVALRVFFLLDTGAPSTFLRPETLTALGLTDASPAAPNVSIHDITVSVGVSHGHFASVDLLGQDFLFHAGALVTIDYAALECEVARPLPGASAAAAVAEGPTPGGCKG